MRSLTYNVSVWSPGGMRSGGGRGISGELLFGKEGKRGFYCEYVFVRMSSIGLFKSVLIQGRR